MGADDPITQKLMRIVAEGLRTLRVRDGLKLDEKLVNERSRNIVYAILMGHDVRPKPDAHTPTPS